jgi:hypothetical protein
MSLPSEIRAAFDKMSKIVPALCRLQCVYIYEHVTSNHTPIMLLERSRMPCSIKPIILPVDSSTQYPSMHLSVRMCLGLSSVFDLSLGRRTCLIGLSSRSNLRDHDGSHVNPHTSRTAGLCITNRRGVSLYIRACIDGGR